MTDTAATPQASALKWPLASHPLDSSVALVDLGAVYHNLLALRQAAPSSQQMVVIKADAYGHGRVPVAMTARAAGVAWFGLAGAGEGMAFRQELDHYQVPRPDFTTSTQARDFQPTPQVPAVFVWIYPPGADMLALVQAGIDISVSSEPQLRLVCQAVTQAGKAARVHLKIDTGLSRSGCAPSEFPALVKAARQAEIAGQVAIVGLWSHFASADDASGFGQSETAAQIKVFTWAKEQAKAGGLQPGLFHLGASSGALWQAAAHFDMVRLGIALYGLNPAAGRALDLELIPAMNFLAPLMQVKQVPAGTRVSYGGTWQALEDTWLGLVPVGYGDGVPRVLSNQLQVGVATGAGNTYPNVGRICMDQFVINLGPAATAPQQVGDTVCLFGSSRFGGPGCPSADQWAAAANTINYEIVTRIGPRVPRAYFSSVPQLALESLGLDPNQFIFNTPTPGDKNPAGCNTGR